LNPRRKSSPDVAAAALARLDVDFVSWNRPVSGARLANRPLKLIASLAEQDEARLRLAIIPLLLRHPDLASIVPEAVKRVSAGRRDVVKLYYTAALLLQQKYAERLLRLFGASVRLTDWYSRELGIPVQGNVDTRLQILARKQRLRSGLSLNWLGTYEHAAERFLQHSQLTRR
jgi:hypothetical protein